MGGGSTWQPECEQEMSFGGTSLRTEVLREHVEALYRKLSENKHQTPEVFHLDYFKLRDGKLYHKGKSKSLTIKGGKLRTVTAIVEILGKEELCELGFNIPRGKVTPRQAVMWNRVEEELPSTSDVAIVGDIELQEIMANAARSVVNLIEQLEGESSENLPMHELIGLNKQLRSSRGSLKVEVAKKVQLEERIEKEKHKLEEI